MSGVRRGFDNAPAEGIKRDGLRGRDDEHGKVRVSGIEEVVGVMGNYGTRNLEDQGLARCHPLVAHRLDHRVPIGGVPGRREGLDIDRLNGIRRERDGKEVVDRERPDRSHLDQLLEGRRGHVVREVNHPDPL